MLSPLRSALTCSPTCRPVSRSTLPFWLRSTIAWAPTPIAPPAPADAPRLARPFAASVFYGRGRAWLEVGICELTFEGDGRAVVRSMTRLDRATFLRYLRQHLAASVESAAAVFVHDADVAFDEACRRTVDSPFRGVSAMFSAPASGTPDAIARDVHLQEFVELVIGQGGATDVRVVARGRP